MPRGTRAPAGPPRITEPPEGAETMGDLIDTAERDAGQTPADLDRVSPLRADAKPADMTPEEIRAEAEKIFAEDMERPQVGDKIARPVVLKLARIMAQMPNLQPAGFNQHFRYHFIKDTQVSAAVRPRMAREGLIVIPNVLEEKSVELTTSRGGKSQLTKLHIEFTIIDAESGDSITGSGYGYGDDAGDKGANKAFTSAMKYWLMKLFQIGGEDDLEDDEHADRRAMDREAGGSQDRQVRVEGANIEGIQRGGRSDRVTATQSRQIGSLLTQLREEQGWSAEKFAEHVKATFGTALEIPENDDPGPVIAGYIRSLSADAAGKLITTLVEEKGKDDDGDDGIPEEDSTGVHPGPDQDQ